MNRKIRNLAIVLFILFLLVSPLFFKVRLQCKSQSGSCPNELNTKLYAINNKSLFRAKKEATTVLTNDNLISNFSLQLKIPNILMVNIIVKKPIFSIYDKSNNKYLLIDAYGMVLTNVENSDLPTLIKDNVSEKSGQKIGKNDLFALNLIQGINQMYQIRTGVTQNDTLVVDLPLAIRVILPVDGDDSQVLLGSLRLIYTKITTDYPGKYSQIDMRFKNPIIR